MKKTILTTTLLLLITLSVNAQQNYYAKKQTVVIDSTITLDIYPKYDLIFIKDANGQYDHQYYMPNIADEKLRFDRFDRSEKNREAAMPEFRRQLATLFCSIFPKELAVELYNLDIYGPLFTSIYYDKDGIIHSVGLSFAERYTSLLNVPPSYYAKFMQEVKKLKLKVVHTENEYNYGDFGFKIEADQLPK